MIGIYNLSFPCAGGPDMYGIVFKRGTVFGRR